MSAKIIVILLINLQIVLSVLNCTESLRHCSRCNMVTKLCVQCDKNIYVPDEYGGCKNSKKCVLNQNFCMECNEQGNLCSKCEEGYFPDENGGCSYSANCEASYEGKCVECIENFVLVGADNYYAGEIAVCKSNSSQDLMNCETIDEQKGICTKCKEGYYLNSGDSKCSTVPNCYQSSFGICTMCNMGYYLNKRDDKCEKETSKFHNCKETLNNEECEVCRSNYYFDGNKICIFYNYCDESNESGFCTKCVDSYYLTSSGDSCTQTQNCLNGDKEMGVCLKCEKDYYLDLQDGQCKLIQVEGDFKYCILMDEEKCQKCMDSYHLTEDYRCTPTKNCAESSNGVCILCSDEYHLGLDNRCSNVENCIYSNQYDECVECIDGYYYEKSNKTCEVSEDEFKNCKHGSIFKGCEECKNDYYLNKTDRLCYSNQESGPFHKCKETDATGLVCEKCLEDYFLGKKDKKCTKVKWCVASENEDKCIECEEFYCLNQKNWNCFPNSKIESDENKFYYNCNMTNAEGTACENCEAGYEVKNGFCYNIENCREKKEDGTCSECQSDDAGIFCLNNLFGCVENYYDTNCLECSDYLDFTTCTKCKDGYELNDYKICVKID